MDASRQANHAKPPLRVVIVGGGSGGHITPLLAVSHELKILQPACQIIYVGQRGDSLGDVPARDPSVDATYTVRAGKLRRYHGEGIRQLLDISTLLQNIRDVGFVLLGIGQSYRLLRRLKPQVIFTRGSFVSVPVAIAAVFLGIPYITHDSDAIPSLANRIIARWAAVHAVALPKETYPYPQAKTIMVGVPVSHKYHLLRYEDKVILRSELGLQAAQKIILVTGGGLGAQRLNDAVAAVVPELLDRYPSLVLIHLAGRSLANDLCKLYDKTLMSYPSGVAGSASANGVSVEDASADASADDGASRRARVRVIGFTDSLYKYSGVADVVIARAGGTSMAEFAAQAKACIIVPNPQLAGGHQTKNAQVLADQDAIRVLDEPSLKADPQILLRELSDLLDNPALAVQLGNRLHSLAQSDSAQKLAGLVFKLGIQKIKQ